VKRHSVVVVAKFTHIHRRCSLLLEMLSIPPLIYLYRHDDDPVVSADITLNFRHMQREDRCGKTMPTTSVYCLKYSLAHVQQQQQSVISLLHSKRTISPL